MNPISNCKKRTKPIIVFGPPRSGTSITTRIIQAHISGSATDLQFPFEVNRHNEPEDLVAIHERFLLRKGKKFIDRFYFPDIEPDSQLFTDLTNFYKKYENTVCVIKDPLLTITLNWLSPGFMKFYCYRNPICINESIAYHKRDELTNMQASKSVVWFLQNRFYREHATIHFESKEKYIESIKKVLRILNIEFRQDLFDALYNEEEIMYYKKNTN